MVEKNCTGIGDREIVWTTKNVQALRIENTFGQRKP